MYLPAPCSVGPRLPPSLAAAVAKAKALRRPDGTASACLRGVLLDISALGCAAVGSGIRAGGMCTTSPAGFAAAGLSQRIMASGALLPRTMAFRTGMRSMHFVEATVLAKQTGMLCAALPRSDTWGAVARGFAADAGRAGTAGGGTALHAASSSGAAAPLPGARDCDDAIEQYSRARSSYRSRMAPPSTYRTATQRAVDVVLALLRGTGVVLAWLARLPGQVWSLRTWSREDWGTWWAGVKKVTREEAHHYWVGFKLLAFDTRVASGLALKAMRGNTLTRRERRQLTRTTADLFRLVPMVIILVIPFLELALPVLLKLFPNMLPSTFQDKMKKEEEVKKRLVVKMEVAQFLQDTVAEMAKDIKSKRTGDISTSAAELYAFINRVRAGGAVSNDELVRFASLFNDELTLDNLDRVQLVSMCQLLGIPPFGTDGFLRSRLRGHLDGLKQDDRLIRAEGLESLTDDELRSSCKTRGMKAAYGSGARDYMMRQMAGWLDLSLNRGLPSSLLLLSRAFTLTAGPAGAAQGTAAPPDELGRVRDTLLTLPEEVIKDVGLEVASASSGAEELAKRLHLMQKEQRLIQAEAQAAQLEAAATAPAAMAGAHVAPPAAAAVSADGAAPGPLDRVLEAEPSPGVAGATVPPAPSAEHAAALATATAVLKEASAGALAELIAEDGISEEQRLAGVAAAREARMRQLLNAITVLASSSGVATERARFMDLVRSQIASLADTHGGASPSLTFTGGALTAVRPEDTAPQLERELAAPLQLEERVSGILLRLERELDAAEESIGEAMHVLDLDNDGLISAAELNEALRFLKANLDEEDLAALLDKLEVKGGKEGAVIPVAELIKLAEPGPGSSGGSGEGTIASKAAAVGGK